MLEEKIKIKDSIHTFHSGINKLKIKNLIFRM